MALKRIRLYCYIYLHTVTDTFDDLMDQIIGQYSYWFNKVYYLQTSEHTDRKQGQVM